jgi:hypothetical protein
MNNELVQAHLELLLQPIYKQIHMCDDSQEIALLAIGLLNVARHNLDLHLSVEQRKILFGEFS